MRVRVIFLLKNKGAYLPFHHQYLLAQLADALMTDEKLPPFRDYTFSALKGQTKVSQFGLHYYSTRTTLVFSSPDTHFTDNFLSRLFEQKEILLGNLELIPEYVEQELPLPDTEEMKCVSLSPMVLVHPSVNAFNAKKFIPPDTNTFSDLLYESVMARMERSGLFTAEQLTSFYRFQVVPDKVYLAKIKEQEKKFARIYPVYAEDGQKQEVRGYTFPFTLYAAPEVKKFVLDCGIGALTHRGFGMLDLAQADLFRKTEPYPVHQQALVGKEL
jgi:CRISPR-associated endoribonuclease Cas6